MSQLIRYTALLHIACGLAVAMIVVAGRAEFSMGGVPVWNYLIVVLSLVSISGFLILSGYNDQRAVALGSIFLVLASTYAVRLVNFTQGAPEWVGVASDILERLAVDAFIPFFVWKFFAEFPQVPTTKVINSIQKIGIWMATAVGISLFIVNFIPPDLTTDWMKTLNRANRDGPYWGIIFSLTLLALPLPFVRSRFAPAEESRRFGFFVRTFFVCTGLPLAYVVTTVVVPGSFEKIVEAGLYPIISSSIQLLIVVLAAGAAYSVKVDRILDSRTLLTRYLSHSLLERLVHSFYLIPTIVAGYYLYHRRTDDLASILSGEGFIWISSCFGAAILGFSYRRKLGERLNDLYRHARSDTESAVNELVERTRSVTSLEVVAEIMEEIVINNLQVQWVRVFLPGVQQDRKFYDLVSDVSVTKLLRDSRYSFVDLQDRSIVLSSDVEKTFAARGYAGLSAFLDVTNDSFSGYLALGPMHSEVPFSDENAKFLSAFGTSASLVVSNILTRADEQQECAQECIRCGRINPANATTCENCQAISFRDAALPHIIGNKYELLTLLGAGAMGVVYKAVDLDLGRAVAVKTHPSLGEVANDKLMGEARSMARVHHPNITTIFSVELWKNHPYIVEELHDSGTLADLLNDGAIGVERTKKLVRVIAPALAKLHESGIVHGDIKPANFGLSSEGEPKLMDFGVSWFADESAQTASERKYGGTMLYASPERLTYQEASPEVDIWAFAVVVYQCLTGQYPFGQPHEALKRIVTGDVAEMNADQLDFTSAQIAFLAQSLSKDRQQRPLDMNAFEHLFNDAFP